MSTVDRPALGEEDAKLVTLARSAQLRAHVPYGAAAEGAAVRDADGRTYAAATVQHREDRLTISALRGAIAAAASSGVRTFEAAAVVTTLGMACADDVHMLAEFGHDVPVVVADPSGAVVRQFLVGDVLGAPDMA